MLPKGRRPHKFQPGVLDEVAMEESRFKLVFEELAEVAPSSGHPGAEASVLIPAQLDEISELRRLSAELAEPEPQSYTLR